MKFRRTWWRILFALVVAFSLLSSGIPAAQASDTGAPVDAAVLAALETEGTADVLVLMQAKADLSPAYGIADWEARGRFVLDALRQVARESQGEVLAYLDAHGIPYTSHYIVNGVTVKGAKAQDIDALSQIPGVKGIYALGVHELPTPEPGSEEAKVQGVEWNISKIKADQVWALYGVKGENIVVANIDTGVDYQHPALKSQYRGNLGNGQYDHNYNWWDPYGQYTAAPYDGNGHGTHTMGTMVGDDGGSNQIGVAPKAKWIAARGCSSNSCYDAQLLEAAEWILAPWDLTGNRDTADPSKRPHVVNNSWGGPGGDPWYMDAVAAWRAAGIFPAFSAGNSGPSCGTAGSPGDYAISFASGATDINDNIASFSSRGPAAGGRIKPDVAAPGVNVRSSVPGGGYTSYSGTSMASPHTAGTVALILSAAPQYVGDVSAVEVLLKETATGKADSQCGPAGPPNNVYGYGIINALAAVEAAAFSGTLQGTVTDASNSQPLQGATVKATNEATGAFRKTTTDASGHYQMTLVEGTYTLEISSFGYETQTITGVEVVKDQVTPQDVALNPSPTATITGTVTDADTGEPLAATVTALGTPVPPAQTDPATGQYSLSLPLGTYTLRAEAPQHLPQEVTVELTEDTAVDFALSSYDLRVLLVDDQGGHSYDARPRYEAALQALGVVYDVFMIPRGGRGPTYQEMAPYDIVIWFTGGQFAYNPGPTAEDESHVIQYLENGGSLFLTSQDYLWSRGLSDFGKNYLGIASFTNDTRSTSITGVAGHPIGGSFGSITLDYPFTNWSDTLVAQSFAQVAFTGNLAPSGIALTVDGLTWKTAFFAFPWEAIPDSTRVDVLDKTLQWLKDKVKTGQLSLTVTHAKTGEPVEGAEVTLTGSRGTFTGTTDADGKFIRKLPTGTYTLVVKKALFEDATVTDVAIEEDAITEVAVALQPLPLPAVAVSPESLEGSAVIGEKTTLYLTVSNVGDPGTVLEFNIKEAGGNPLAARAPSFSVLSMPEPGLRVKGFDPNGPSTRGKYQDEVQSLAMLPEAPGDVITSWPTGMALPWGVGYDGRVFLSNPGAGGGDDHNWIFTPDGQFLKKWPTTSWRGSWAGDMDYDPNRGWIWQVNVGGDNCLYALDPETGAVKDKLCGSGWSWISQRGVAYRAEDDTFYVGGWNTDSIFWIKGPSWDNPGEVIEEHAFPDVSGLAWNELARVLWVATNSPTDTIYGVKPEEGWAIIAQIPHPDTQNSYVGAGLSMDEMGNLWTVSQATRMAYLIDTGIPAYGDVPWLQVEPREGQLEAGSSMTLTVTLDAAQLEQGTYTATLFVVTNDPYQRRVAVPVTFTVTPYVLRVNVGGPQYTDSQGNLWLADHAYGTGGEKYAYGYVVTDAKGKPKKPRIKTTKKSIAGTEDPFLYQSQIADKDFKAYVFDVPNRDGWYEVTLHFAELTEKKPAPADLPRPGAGWPRSLCRHSGCHRASLRRHPRCQGGPQGPPGGQPLLLRHRGGRRTPHRRRLHRPGEGPGWESGGPLQAASGPSGTRPERR
ncbi:MAG: S8 family serine peptidase [Clostridiales bacterium]|nr:S8 family serine peptidase [Clostridiales bacterium]